MKRRRLRIVLALLVIVGIGAAIVATKAAMPRLTERGATVPTARLTKGPLRLTVHATGDLRAGRTMSLVAPPVGGMLRLVKMVPTGVMVKEGDVIVEFDPADQQFTLEQSKSEVQEADQEIAKMQADTAAQIAQDEVGLLTARFAVRRRRARCLGQRSDCRDRGPEERADAGRSEAGARAVGAGRQVARRNQHRLARRPAREAQQGDPGEAAGRAGHRESGAQGADCRGGLGQGQPRRDGRHDDLRHVDARVSRGRLGVARPSGRRRHRVRSHGDAREGGRKRSRQPHRRSGRERSKSTRSPASAFRPRSAPCPGWPAAPGSSSLRASRGSSTSPFSS